MKQALWANIVLWVGLAAFQLYRFRLRRRKRAPGYQVTGYFALILLAPAFGAARELGFFRATVAGAVTALSLVLGLLTGAALWDAHRMREGRRR